MASKDDADLDDIDLDDINLDDIDLDDIDLDDIDLDDIDLDDIDLDDIDLDDIDLGDIDLDDDDFDASAPADAGPSATASAPGEVTVRVSDSGDLTDSAKTARRQAYDNAKAKAVRNKKKRIALAQKRKAARIHKRQDLGPSRAVREAEEQLAKKESNLVLILCVAGVLILLFVVVLAAVVYKTTGEKNRPDTEPKKIKLVTGSGQETSGSHQTLSKRNEATKLWNSANQPLRKKNQREGKVSSASIQQALDDLDKLRTEYPEFAKKWPLNDTEQRLLKAQKLYSSMDTGPAPDDRDDTGDDGSAPMDIIALD